MKGFKAQAMERSLRKLNHAFILKEKIEQAFLNDRNFSILINRLKEHVLRSRDFREHIGLSRLCAICGSKRSDCCGKGIELRYTPEILALNIFFGVDIPLKRRFPDSCYFLSEKGCVLFVRDIFCINFICERIRNTIPLENLKRLWELEGLETEGIFQATEFLKKFETNF